MIFRVVVTFFILCISYNTTAEDEAYAFIEQLTTKFGARPAGGRAELEAAKWGMEYLLNEGFADVRIQKFPLMVWNEGETKVTLINGTSQNFVAVALGGTQPGRPVEGEAMIFESYSAFLEADDVHILNRIVVIAEPIKRNDERMGYVELVKARYEGPRIAQKRGAKGFLIRSLATHQHRIASSGASVATESPFPAFAISPPDAEQLVRLSKYGPVNLRLSSDAGWVREGSSQNVIAVVAGTVPNAKPIIVSAHLDSWGQGTGAVDDGFGLAVITTAAKRLLRAKTLPKRPVWVVWFGAEEVSQVNGAANFPGAVAFSKAHRKELSSFGIAGESDWGGDVITHLTIPLSQDTSTFKTLEKSLASLNVTVESGLPAAPGPDVGVLAKSGVPTFRLHQRGTYLFDVHHTPNDTLEAIDKDALNQNVNVWTKLLEVLANSDDEFKGE